MKKIAISAAIICALGITVYMGLNSVPDEVYTEEPLVSSSAKNNTGKTVKASLIPLKQLDEDSPLLASNLIQQLTNSENPDYVKLTHKAAAIGKQKLSHTDFLALSQFLKLSPPGDNSLLDLHSLKDMIIVMMIKNGAFIEELGDTFNDILADPHQHPVLIDYVSQYIPEYFEKRWQGQDDLQQEEILKSLYKLLDRSDDSLAGTALSVLSVIEDQYPIVDQSLIHRKVFAMLDDSSLTQASRSQALRYLGNHPSQKGGAILKDMAFAENNPVMLRMIAVNSLALHTLKTGEPSDKLTEKFENEILNNPQADKRLLVAARAAFNIIQSSINNNRDQ